MDDGPDLRTRLSLLQRLRAEGPGSATWDEFLRLYGGLIFKWCRKWDLQEADAHDVTQDVLLKLADKMRSFEYDSARSFRAWLKTLTHHAWVDFVSDQRRPGQGSGDSQIGNLLENVEARTDLARHLEEAFDMELLQEATRRVRERVAPQTWEAFRLTALEGLSGAEAAGRIPMQPAQVYIARRRVQQMLREELRHLEESGG